MRTAIIYYSKHHGNTLKLLEAIKEAYPDVELIDVTAAPDVDLKEYDVLGVASGIYYSKFARQITNALDKGLRRGMKIFAIYTCGQQRPSYTALIKEYAEANMCTWLGEYGCRGYDTFGPFKVVGGIAKGHPAEDEIAGAVKFYREKVQAKD